VVSQSGVPAITLNMFAAIEAAYFDQKQASQVNIQVPTSSASYMLDSA
jgi:hypothetical protein